MKMLRAQQKGELDKIYDEKLLRSIDQTQERRRLSGAEVEAFIGFATAHNLIERSAPVLSKLAEATGNAVRIRQALALSGNAVKMLARGVSAAQLITIANNVNDTTITISSSPVDAFCNVDWRAMQVICDVVLGNYCKWCDCGRDKSKACDLRKALEQVPGVRTAVKAVGNSEDCPFAGREMEWAI